MILLALVLIVVPRQLLGAPEDHEAEIPVPVSIGDTVIP